MITIRNVLKDYGKKQVLDDVSLYFPTGVHGLLGPNGAGKTTLMRCILGLVPYQGEIIMQGDTADIGYVPQNFQMMEELSVLEALEYVSLLKGLKGYNLSFILEQTNLSNEKHKKVKHLSGGMLRRLGIAQALIGDSKILLLDEPTVGLDPKERVHLRNLIETLGRERCILLCTHIVEDVQQVGNSVAILHKGKVLIQENKVNLTEKMNGKIGVITIKPDNLATLEQQARVLQVHAQGDTLRCHIYQDPLPIGATPIDISLEDMYLALTQNA